MKLDPVLVAAVVAAAVVVFVKLRKGGKMSQDVVLEKIKAGAQVVDVRSPEEFRDGFYAGAKNIPLQDIPRRMAELKKDKPVVLYCASGARSGMAARMLKQSGFVDVVNAGGLSDMPR